MDIVRIKKNKWRSKQIRKSISSKRYQRINSNNYRKQGTDEHIALKTENQSQPQAMTIITEDSSQIQINLAASVTVTQLKEKICSTQNIYPRSFQLYRNKRINGSNTKKNKKQKPKKLNNHNIKYAINSTVYLYWNTINIYIESATDSIYLTGIKFNYTIAKIKLIYGNSNIRLKCSDDPNEEELDDNKTLKDYKIRIHANHTTLYITELVTLIINQKNKKPFFIQIELSSCIHELKNKISQNSLIIETFQLFLNYHTNCKHLKNDNCTLKEYGITDETTIYLVIDERTPDSMKENIIFRRHNNCNFYSTYDVKRIYIQPLTGNAIIFKVNVNTTIKDIKYKIQDKLKMFYTAQTLIYNDLDLEKYDQCTLRELGIEHEAVIDITFKTKSCDWIVNDLLLDAVVSIINFDTMTDRYFKMKQLFMNTCRFNNNYLKIESVFNIEKKYKWNMMIYEQLLNTKTDKNEKLLFHGTSLQNINNIIDHGFNRDYNKRSLYGKGTYFSNYAYIAADYCSKINVDKDEDIDNNDDTDLYAMLCCRVYIGDYTKGSLFMNESELYKHDKVTQYDSLVNNIYNPSIYVINRDYHSVPCYIIIFSTHKK